MKPFTALLLVMLLFMITPSHAAETAKSGKILVHVKNLKSSDGQVLLSLFNDANREFFPGKREHALAVLKSPITNGVCTLTFENVPAGVYAIGAIHDENNNGKMDTNFLGIPREGVGASNNPKPRFGPPLFDDTKFVFDGSTLNLDIGMM